MTVARRVPGEAPRILLVNPMSQRLGWERRFQIPPMALLQVAACTPDPWKVSLWDETHGLARVEGGWDLVGITAMTHQAGRAYELAGRFRAAGVPVVLGGIHPTVLPQEAALHADSVVVGEAEPVWAGLLDDLTRGRLAPLYESPEPQGDVLDIPCPRRDVLDGRPYLTRQVLQASRGCPYDCPFCTVTPHFGRRFRYRPAEEILDEVRRLPGEFLLFLDDNLLGDPRRAVPILEGLVPMGKRWVTQTTLHFAEDPELLALMRRSGCMGVFVGVEGLSGDLAGLPKLRARLPMAELVTRAQDAGILVEVSMIFGLDDHGPEVFEEAVGFVKKCAPSGATFHILTPYPGTQLFRQFEEEGRLLHKEWPRYNHSQVVFLPRRMSPDELYAGWVGARREAYSWPSILSRVGRNPHHRLANLAYNVFRRAPSARLSTVRPS